MSDIMSISRLRMGTDGEGIRTLVGFYGCPLKCKYCINKQCNQWDTARADYTVEELLETLSIDEPYFLMSNGGVTFGGGEPLMQAEFIHEVCSKMNPQWSRCIETSLYSSWKQIELLLDDIDYWYIDLKAFDRDIYKLYTGKSNKYVISNLKKLLKAVPAEKICVRLPVIPEYNDYASITKAADYLHENISNKITIDIFDYIRC